LVYETQAGPRGDAGKDHGSSSRLLRAYGEMETGQAAAHSVEAALKALAEIKAATMIGCPF